MLRVHWSPTTILLINISFFPRRLSLEFIWVWWSFFPQIKNNCDFTKNSVLHVMTRTLTRKTWTHRFANILGKRFYSVLKAFSMMSHGFTKKQNITISCSSTIWSWFFKMDWGSTTQFRKRQRTDYEPASKNTHLMKFLPIPVASRISVRHPCRFRPVVQFFHTLSNISNISDKGYK